MTAHDLHSIIARMDDRTKLMLIDQIADTLDGDQTDEFCDGLAAEFERAEQGFSGVFTPLYPAGNSNPEAWREWRLERDHAVAAWLHLYGRKAA